MLVHLPTEHLLDAPNISQVQLVVLNPLAPSIMPRVYILQTKNRLFVSGKFTNTLYIAICLKKFSFLLTGVNKEIAKFVTLLLQQLMCI